MEPQWIPSFSFDELVPGEGRTLRHGSRQVAVFRLDDGTVRAVDNRCPHEGYPLAQGTVCGAVLTCWYHNFKYDLRDGSCLVGDERVTLFPVRVEGGRVYVDVAGPDPSIALGERWASLDEAVHEARPGQIARDVVRLLDLGESPAAIARFAAAWDGAHAEYGATHALPVAAEALRLFPFLPGLSAARALVPALELASEPSTRRPSHPTIAPLDPGSAETFVDRLRAAVEAEDQAVAIGLVRGAIAAGFGREVLESAFARILSDHLFDYGHGLIYATKVFDLGDVGELDAVLTGLVRSFVFASRDDRVPGWAPWRRRMEELDLAEFADQTGPLADREVTVQALLDASPRDSVEVVLDALRAGAAPLAIVDALSLASAERLLRFDVALDLDPQVRDAWLDVTHLLTFTAAIRTTLARWQHPELLRLLFQASRQIARIRPLDGPHRPPTPVAGTVDELLAAIRARDADRAVAIALGVDPRAVRWPLVDLALDAELVRPVVHAHGLKLSLAACDEVEALGDGRPLAAAVRFLASPKTERRTGQRISEAIALVRDGRPPKVLAV